MRLVKYYNDQEKPGSSVSSVMYYNDQGKPGFSMKLVMYYNNHEKPMSSMRLGNCLTEYKALFAMSNSGSRHLTLT